MNQTMLNAAADHGRSVSASPSPTPPDTTTSLLASARGRRTTSTQASSGSMRTGRWTLDEKLLFLYGLRKYGKGRWKKISVYLPHRSLVQIKSHAQKVMKRHDNGEDVFARLQEHMTRTEALVAQIHEDLHTEGLVIPPPAANAEQGWVRPVVAPHRDSTISTSTNKTVVDVREQIVAASALCQLSSQPTQHPVNLKAIVLGSNFTPSKVLEI